MDFIQRKGVTMGIFSNMFSKNNPDRKLFLSALPKLESINDNNIFEYHIAIGQCYHQSGNYIDGAHHYENALYLNDDSSTAMFCIAEVFKDSGFHKSIFNNPLSFTWYDSIKVLSDYSNEYTGIGIAFNKYQETELAIHFYKLAEKENNPVKTLYPLLANEYSILGEYTNALIYVKKAIELFPNNNSLLELKNKIVEKSITEN
jgi:tetratricopeptide (TPR) repeat protein